MYRGSSRDVAFRPPNVVSGQESLPHATRGPAEREHVCLFLGRGHVMASFFSFFPPPWAVEKGMQSRYWTLKEM